MIRTALKFIQKELDSFIAYRENDISLYPPGHIVSMNSLALPDGGVNINQNSNITMMLVCLEEERSAGKQPYFIPLDNREKARVNPPLEISMQILFAANKSDYPTALRDLSSVLSFFQSRSVFQQDAYPAMNEDISDMQKKDWQKVEKLIFGIKNLSLEQQNNLWSMIGLKYLPSVVYNVKMLSLFDTAVKEKSLPVTDLGISETSN